MSKKTIARRLLDHPWLRRSFTMPLWSILALASAALYPLVVPLLIVWDSATGARLGRTRAFTWLTVALVNDVAGLVICGALWLARWLLLWRKERYLRANYALQKWWYRVGLFSGCGLFRVQVYVEPSARLAMMQGQSRQPSQKRPEIMLMRHLSVADSALAYLLFGDPPHQRLPLLVGNINMLWHPALDVVGLRLPNVFLTREQQRSRSDRDALTELAQHMTPRHTLLLYPEGTRYSPERWQRRMEQLQRQDPKLAELAAPFRHVLPPKLGGVMALLAARPDADVVLVNHTGFDAARKAQALWNGQILDTKVKISAKRIPAEAIPREPEEQARWLYRMWGNMEQELCKWDEQKRDGTLVDRRRDIHVGFWGLQNGRRRLLEATQRRRKARHPAA